MEFYGGRYSQNPGQMDRFLWTKVWLFYEFYGERFGQNRRGESFMVKIYGESFIVKI
jgi:hypothetical protein